MGEQIKAKVVEGFGAPEQPNQVSQGTPKLSDADALERVRAQFETVKGDVRERLKAAANQRARGWSTSST